MAKSEAKAEMTHVDLVLGQRKKPIAIGKYMCTFHNVVSQRTEFSRSWRIGQPWYGAECSFLMDFNLLSH